MNDIGSELTAIDEQAGTQDSLPLSPIDPPTSKEMAVIARFQAMPAVYRWMIQCLEERISEATDGQVEITDKQLAAQIGMDPGQFSRVVTHGSANFSEEKEHQFMRLCGSGAPVFWRLHRMGLDPTTIRPLESEYQRQIRELQEQVGELQKERAVLARAVRGEYE